VNLKDLDVQFIMQLLMGLGFLWAAYSKMNRAEEQIAKRVKTLIIAEDVEAKKNGTPQPLIVQMAENFVSLQVHQELKQDVESLSTELRGIEKRLMDAGAHREEGIHRRISYLVEKVGELRGELNRIGKR